MNFSKLIYQLNFLLIFKYTKMKKQIITTFFMGGLFFSTSSIAQVDFKFTATTDLSQYDYSGTNKGVIENNKLLSVTVKNECNWSNILYKGSNGFKFGSDNFVVVKSSKPKYQLVLKTNGGVHLYCESKSVKAYEGDFYIHTYKLSNLTPQNVIASDMTFESMQLKAHGLKGGDVVLLEWAKSFPDETTAKKYVKTLEKVDVTF
jgi:hypothetical protein